MFSVELQHAYFKSHTEPPTEPSFHSPSQTPESSVTQQRGRFTHSAHIALLSSEQHELRTVSSPYPAGTHFPVGGLRRSAAAGYHSAVPSRPLLPQRRRLLEAEGRGGRRCSARSAARAVRAGREPRSLLRAAAAIGVSGSVGRS